MSYRIGQIVPSSNVTMETEIPAIFRARESVCHERFTFHSSRMRMTHVSPEQLAAMDEQSDRCAIELSDARVDVLGYACLVAIMASGLGYHCQSEQRLHQQTIDNGAPAPVVTSAGALIDGLHVIGAKRIVLVAPYVPALTETVVAYIRHEGFEVLDYVGLNVADNLAVAGLDPADLLAHAKGLDRDGADAVVLSACVQMPSLAAIQPVEDALGLPVVSAAVCTAHRMMRAIGLPAVAPNFGALLAGDYRLADPVAA